MSLSKLGVPRRRTEIRLNAVQCRRYPQPAGRSHPQPVGKIVDVSKLDKADTMLGGDDCRWFAHGARAAEPKQGCKFQCAKLGSVRGHSRIMAFPGNWSLFGLAQIEGHCLEQSGLRGNSNTPRSQRNINQRQRVCETQTPPPDPEVADTAPSDSVMTVYDEQHVVTYLRLLDADAQGADWREVARTVLHLDLEHGSHHAPRVFGSHALNG
jgi:hypothetical protein